jgi:gliding motility-associated-like protein
LCSNQSVELVNSSSVDFGSITRVRIFWGDSSSVSYLDSQPYPGKLYSHNYPNPVSANPASYTIRMLSFSGISCEDELDQLITVQPGPHVQFSAIPHVCVYDSPLVITQGVELTGLSGSSSYFGNGISADGLFSPPEAGAGVSKLMFRFAAGDGCVDSAFQTISVIAPPVLDAGNDTSVVINQPLQLQARTEDFAEDHFLWSPPTGLDDPGIANPVAVFSTAVDSIKYFVKATDTAGCYTVSSLLVKVFNTLPDIFVPNAFTPGSTRNNIFRPIPVGITSLQYFRVYNRWGQMVYSTSQLGQGWDGTLGGKPLETDGFVWTVQGFTYTGKSIFKKGTVTLIR